MKMQITVAAIGNSKTLELSVENIESATLRIDQSERSSGQASASMTTLVLTQSSSNLVGLTCPPLRTT
jgi:hypothetical protein